MIYGMKDDLKVLCKDVPLCKPVEFVKGLNDQTYKKHRIISKEDVINIKLSLKVDQIIDLLPPNKRNKTLHVHVYIPKHNNISLYTMA